MTSRTKGFGCLERTILQKIHFCALAVIPISITKIFYLDDDRNLINEKIEIAKYHIYDDCRKECYFNELVKLEDSLEDSKFLHIGNCLILEIKGKKRVAFLEEIDAKFLSIAYSCDPTIKPFTYTLNSFDLTNMLPWESLHFHKGKSGFSLQEKFIAFSRTRSNYQKRDTAYINR